MRRVWAAVLSVWSTLAIVGVLAWSHPTPPAAHVVVLPNGTAVQTVTSSSKVAASPATQLVSGVQAQTPAGSG